MDAALEAGINFFDTANVYGGRRRPSRSSAAGSRRAAAGGRRSCWPPRCTAVATRGRTRRGCPRSHIRQACEDSLRRLQTDHIDLYQMHHVDRDTSWDEIWQAMDLLVAQGKVLYVGSSNFAGWHLVQANEAARRRGSLGLVSEQSLYNLRARTVELEVLPAARGLWHRRPAVEPARGRSARRRAEEGHRGTAGCRARHEAGRAQPRPARGVGGPVRGAGRGARRRGAGVAPASGRRHRSDHRAPHGRAVHRVAAGARASRSTRRRSTASTRSSPARAAPRRRPTPGSGGRRPRCGASSRQQRRGGHRWPGTTRRRGRRRPRRPR